MTPRRLPANGVRPEQVRPNGSPLSVELPEELVAVLAERVAARLVDRESRPEPWIGVELAAEHLECPASRIYALSSAGRIPCERDGSRLLFRRSALDEWVRAGGGKRP